MEFVLLVLGLLALLVQAGPVHLILILIHAVVALWLVRRYIGKRPLMCLFILAYMAMYFPNPVAVITGWVPLEFTSSQTIFFVSTAMQMIGLDLFLIGAIRLRSRRWHLDQLKPMRVNPIGAEVCIILAIAFCTITLVTLVMFVSELRVNVFGVAKTWRASAGYHNTAYLRMQYAFALLPAAAFLITLKPAQLQIPYWIPVAVLMAAFFMIMRNRTAPIAMAVAIVTGVILRNRLVAYSVPRARRKFPARLKLFLVAALPTVMVLGIGGKYLRQAYAVHNYRFGEKEFIALMEHTFASGGDLSFALFLRHAIRLYPANHEFLHGQTYYRALFVPIPRSVWPDKPINSERLFAAALSPELKRRNVTIPAGLVGVTYINFGYPGILLMLAWGWAFTRERYRGFFNVMFLAGGGIWMFHMVRGNFTTPLVSMAFIGLFCLLCTRLSKPVFVQGRGLRPGPAAPAPPPQKPRHVRGMPRPASAQGPELEL